MTFCRRIQSDQQFYQSCFSCSGRANKGNGFALLYIESNVFHGRMFGCFVLETHIGEMQCLNGANMFSIFWAEFFWSI